MGINLSKIEQLLAALLLMAALLLGSSSAYAFDVIDESAIWPAVAQGHHSDNNSGCNTIGQQLTIYNGSNISGTEGNDLAFCSMNNFPPADSCDTAAGGTRACTVSNSSVEGLKMNGNQGFQSSNGSAGGISYCNSGDQINLGDVGDTQFTNLSFYSDCTVTFSSANSEYRFDALNLGGGATAKFPAGDYWIKSLQINSLSQIETSGAVRIFISDSSNLNGGVINSLREPGVQVIAYNGLSLNGGGGSQSEIYANVYSEDTITLNSGSIFGKVTAKYLVMNSDGHIGTPPDPTPTFHIQYGIATSGNVTFDTPFPDGSSPLIFLMPTIEQTNTNSDGPASVFLTGTPSTTGFSWSQQESPSPANRYVASNPMAEVHWIAVTAGTHDLSNGTQLIAGTVDVDDAVFRGNPNYVDVALPNSHDVLLNQLQTNVNDCWFTSTSLFNNNGGRIGIDVSEVSTNNANCQPGGLNNSQLQAETVAYLSVQSGNGVLALNGENINFHFGAGAQTFTGGGTRSLAYQCGITTNLIGFTEVPVLVAGKNSRRGGDGGWLRRCQLTNSVVSMVLDEDTYRDSDRSHFWENYSFVAFEKNQEVFECFTDDFARIDVGEDWVVSSSQGTFTPSIVSNRLRITEAAGNQATSSTYQRLFPAADNLVTIEFDHYAYGGSGADGIAFVLSDGSITPQAGAYGGPLGYGARSTVDGFAGGWLGFGIDEYGNFSAEGGPDGPGRRQQSVSIRGSGSGTVGYPYLRGTCNNGQTNPAGGCLSPTVDNNNTTPAHRYRITVDSRGAGQSIVSVERDTGSGYVELIAPFDAAAEPNQAAIPADFLLSLTGSTGGATNNHEIDNVEICALDSNPIGLVIDHFEFEHSGGALTCEAEAITLKACADAACSTLVTDQVTATLSPVSVTDGGGWIGGNTVVFSGGQTQLELRKNTPGTVTIDVSDSIPRTQAYSNTLCSIAGGTATEANCTLTYDDSGFIFGTAPGNIDSGNQFAKLANRPFDVTVSAVKKDDATQECVPTFANTSKSLSFWSTYVDPNSASVAATQSVSIDGSNIGQSLAAASPVNLVFDAQGQATMTVNYPDAGKVQLNTQYLGTGDEAGLVMTGNKEFVSFPVGLCVTPVDNNAACIAGDASCNVYKKAGETFEFTVQGMAWQADGDGDYCTGNASTPNYAHQGMVLSHSLVAPNPGTLGLVSNENYNHVVQTSNTNTVTQAINEVGVFNFSVKSPTTYLGSDFYDIPLASTGNIGRFVPDRFVVSGVSVLPACGSFSYMDQPFPMAMNISAFNITPSYVTENYQGAFAKATASLVGENNDDGIDLSARLSALPVSSGSWVAGVATIDSSYFANVSRTSAPAVDGPFSLLDIGIQLFDNDGDFAFVANPDMRPDTSGNCATPSNTCTAKLLSTQDLRHGRVTMDNTYGPENEILRMPVYAQYWNGSAWVTNADDSCTTLAGTLDPSATYNPALGTNEVVSRSAAGNISSGEQDLLWQNTGSNLYRGQVTAELDVALWLKWYWNWDELSANNLVDPRASAFFGRYRGHDRIIYWQEVN